MTEIINPQELGYLTLGVLLGFAARLAGVEGAVFGWTCLAGVLTVLAVNYLSRRRENNDR